MTVSQARRKADIDVAVRHMLATLGDQWVRDVEFDASHEALTDLLPTTWVDLERLLVVTGVHAMQSRKYQFTARGWLKALKITGAVTDHMGDCSVDPAIRRRVTTLMQALKQRVKGRQDGDQLALVKALAAETGLPEGWISNCVESSLICWVFPDRQVFVRLEAGRVRIPPTFGMEQLIL